MNTPPDDAWRPVHNQPATVEQPYGIHENGTPITTYICATCAKET